MSEDAVKQDAQAGCPEAGCCKDQTSMRSMPKKCMEMMGKRPSIFLIVLAGALLIALGVLIVVEPQVLVWLVAAGVALMGVMLLAMAGWMRRPGARPRG